MMEKGSKVAPLVNEEIRIRGRDTRVPGVVIGGRTTVVLGRWLRVAQPKDEDLIEGVSIPDPGPFLRELCESPLSADIFTFADYPPWPNRLLPYHMEWDNWASLTISTYDDWWQRLPQESRKNVRRAAKRRVVVKLVPFNDELVAGIKGIYDESPVRQGRTFWHYGKSLDAVRRMNETYANRSVFIGAYLDDTLVGFVKLVFIGEVGTLMQIVAMHAHRDKRCMNALLAEAVRACERRGCTMLAYGNYTYGNNSDSSLAEFKRRNGFVELKFPRYFVPLTIKGRLAIAMNLHKGLIGMLPRAILKQMLKVRNAANELRLRLGTHKRTHPEE